MSEQNFFTRQTVYGLAAGLLLGFLAGFFLTNSINRKEQDKLRAELTRARSGAPEPGATPTGGQGFPTPPADGEDLPTLTDEQLKLAVARDDAEPTDVELQ